MVRNMVPQACPSSPKPQPVWSPPEAGGGPEPTQTVRGPAPPLSRGSEGSVCGDDSLRREEAPVATGGARGREWGQSGGSTVGGIRAALAPDHPVPPGLSVLVGSPPQILPDPCGFPAPTP